MYDLPLTYDLYLFRGDTYRRGLVIKDNANVPYPLTGAVFLAQIRYSHSAPTPVVTLEVTPDTDQVSFPGRVWFEVAADNFDGLYPVEEVQEVGVWDLQVTWGSTDVLTYLEGTVYLKGDVSRG